MSKDRLLTLCIPTNGESRWVLPTLSSIFGQGCDNDLFDVVVVDNGTGSDLEERVAELNYPNLVYLRSEEQGFMNIIFSLKQGSGLYRKMLNHRSCLVPGALNDMSNIVEANRELKPVLYFSDANVGKTDGYACGDLDSFVNTLSHWCSWSAGVGVWADDLALLDGLNYDKMFPNTSLLLDLRPEGPFYICDKKYQKMQDEAGKGGYDLFRTFSVGFLDIISRIKGEGRITERTFIKVKDDLYVFLREMYRNLCVLHNPNTFILTGIKESMSVYYSSWHYYRMVAWSYSIGLLKLLPQKIKKS